MRQGRSILACAALVIAAAACQVAPRPPGVIGTPEPVAPGVDLFRTADRSLVDDAGPIAAFLIRLDPARVRLESVLSNSEVMNAEPVEDIARRVGAIAAINGGYFNRDNGEPIGVLKVGGELVSDTGAPRAAVIIHASADAPVTLAFDQIAAKVVMTFSVAGRERRLPVDGVDTTRARGKLMLYTPAYHADTDTAPTGTEWTLEGAPLRVVERRARSGHTPIPRSGAVLSFGGVDLPEDLAALTPGTAVSFETVWTSASGLPPDVLNSATDIVGGAGLLRRDGHAITDWQLEGLSPEAFTNARHPRTVIGVDRGGFIWLAAIDGRQPQYSVGMTFGDLERLCDVLGLTDAINLDGGGSTTLVVKGRILNTPADATGPRPVSDALVVLPRPRGS